MRHLVRAFRDSGHSLPLTSHILIAVSGGSDSTAVARLLCRYGRRIVPDPRSQISLLHVNHGWRGEESDADEAFVRSLAGELGVGFLGHRLTGKPPRGRSWEDHARDERKRIFAVEAQETGGIIVTGHTADDVAETLIWRIFTGAWEREPHGILEIHGVEFRPALQIRKTELQAFLEEEGVTWREDPTNHEGRFLRSRIRKELVPALESIFPRAIEHVLSLRPPVSNVQSRRSPRRKTKGRSPKKNRKSRSQSRLARR